jgi:hypothetical protein
MRLDIVASTILNTFRAVTFLPDWTTSAYRTRQNGFSSFTFCASICEVDEKCSFFFFNASTCFLGNLTMNNTGLAPMFTPKKILINESKLILCI